ncbi:carbohydrate esterase family 1 protein [Serpula lacrymans var. lacrymans S7.3]|uniref:S-formylglutathione hydrolase n=2 Tax=Serpula lacrymans var. lacrymans TaxID=341189 RepID=F8PG65_SERL3|nr:carbohydrate esterase family 1 protein [Serpula lacrymans var. lacrymans S7.9]EGO04312.1 carbohydrate esterase family 1 protein [Serpula lacrymans var. lacrymans S7.3]EGO30235.1 carbohydrate esterase family 1 protein [Serpula lacrymans var. lacrymans S7.9]
MTSLSLEKISSNKHHGGELTKYKFKSVALGGTWAQFNLFTPANAAQGKVPLLVYLAGLTCTEDNGAQKGGFMRDAAAEGIALLFPDTSPRGAEVEGEDSDWDFGTGAGFYLNATNPKYSTHYNMLNHVMFELPRVIGTAGFPIDLKRQSVFGHSMGGHGALTFYLSSLLHSKQYRSASAFSPICNPTKSPWGDKAFKGYLQNGVEEAMDRYDATKLIAKTKEPVHILIDYGTGDNFLDQLHPAAFLKAARDAGHDEVQVRVRSHDGYDHSYYFIMFIVRITTTSKTRGILMSSPSSPCQLPQSLINIS